ncbi:AmmeMemoRadiSam system protein B [Glycomyces sp. TRM65418]|uniref:AmmeMemoRadiSam system protein B n=1 Tax=Glycomyces sp. TRM65418 TaxID=2867006 RepID=UPI001CE63DEA|nr:AmmeMemoRadiSam system protein B [Glycomyces sp. TRM65418]MCC3763545.1 AmmeMemoRadiSam system protein B [Glycomyces sp. TRM65418]QZD57528.1 AmmeMemoRadiSam system protein B [Glycomyces sp. TRM65418]
MPTIKSDTVRPPAVAGRFYPADPGQLRADIERLIDTVGPVSEPLAAAYIAPHAGYGYSGPVAAEVYARLAAHRGRVKRVVLVGPSHHSPLRGHAAAPYARWDTPLGQVRAVPTTVVGSSRLPHQSEHSLEVQLPFLQVALGEDIEVTPVACGMSQTPDTARVIAALLEEAGEDAVLICSTDLSHYHDQATADRVDAATAEAIRSLRPREIAPQHACGVFALRGTLAWADATGRRPRQLALATSAETAGRPDRVVGYPAFAIERPVV